MRLASSSSNKRWVKRQSGDRFAREAKLQGLKSRAAFKLLQINERYRLFRPGMTVVDLGFAPGSWSQVAAQLTSPTGRVLGVDLIPAQPPRGVSAIQGNFLSLDVQAEIRSFLRDPERGRPRPQAVLAVAGEGEGGGEEDGGVGVGVEKLQEGLSQMRIAGFPEEAGCWDPVEQQHPVLPRQGLGEQEHKSETESIDRSPKTQAMQNLIAASRNRPKSSTSNFSSNPTSSSLEQTASQLSESESSSTDKEASTRKAAATAEGEEEAVVAELESGEGESKVIDIILSDMCAPWDLAASSISASGLNLSRNSISNPFYRMINTSGNSFRDHVGSMDLCNSALQFAITTLKPGGHFICKYYAGAEDKLLEKKLRALFTKVHREKPESSRAESRENFFVGIKRKRHGLVDWATLKEG